MSNCDGCAKSVEEITETLKCLSKQIEVCNKELTQMKAFISESKLTKDFENWKSLRK